MNISFPKIYPVACHTDNIGPGSTFVAIKGQKLNGIDYIAQAIEKGATHIVHQGCHLPESVQSMIVQKAIKTTCVNNTRRALAELSAQALNYPAKKLKIIGVTGTKGKTTSVFLIDYLLKKNNYKTALLSTVHNHILDQVLPSSLTTSHPDYLHVFFDQCVKVDVDFVIMEVAAQGLSLERTFGIEFAGGLFTNFDLEHSEFYPTIDDYFKAKCLLINQMKSPSTFLINSDNERLNALSHQWKIPTFSLKNDSIIKGKINAAGTAGIDGLIRYQNKNIPFHTNLIGSFNAYNLVGAIGLLQLMNVSLPIESLANINVHVPGRMETYLLANGTKAIIDYAHNPSSFQSLFSTLSTITSKLIVVFGAGGERDPIKRPLMGALAAQYATHIILTTDNPRSEKAENITNDILGGISNVSRNKVIIELDREKAIKKAYELSNSASIIALLGKGPDEYQLINGVKYPFSERAILKQFCL